jgi:hypothetical protein
VPYPSQLNTDEIPFLCIRLFSHSLLMALQIIENPLLYKRSYLNLYLVSSFIIILINTLELEIKWGILFLNIQVYKHMT